MRKFRSGKKTLKITEKVTNTPQYSILLNKIQSLMTGRIKPLLVALDGRSGVGNQLFPGN